MKNLLFGALVGTALIAFTGCTNGDDAQMGAKCQSGKCQSGKCQADKAKAKAAKCGGKKSASKCQSAK